MAAPNCASDEEGPSGPPLWITSLAHHIPRERVWWNLQQIPKRSAPEVNGREVRESFGVWIEPHASSHAPQGFPASAIRRVYNPQAKQEKRSLGVPCVSERGPERSAAQVLYAIYERTSCRVRLGTHRALATLNAVIAGGKVSWMLERRTYSINSSARESRAGGMVTPIAFAVFRLT